MKTEKTVVRSLRFPLSLWEAVQKIAKQEFTTPAAVIRRAVAEWVKQKQKEG